MTEKQQTFAQLMGLFAYRYDLRSVFDEFLTMSICACGYDPVAKQSRDEDLYLQTMARYADDELRHIFPKLFARLVSEMEERMEGGAGNDVLGEYYEQNFCRKGAGQFFTPAPVCDFMAISVCGDAGDGEERKRVLDPTCGSGRMLLSASKAMGRQHEFYGIDIDHTCVKMAALNLFLNGMFHSEVMWADALRPDDFRMSYSISLLPFGIFRIQEKERSKLWHMYRNSFPQRNSKRPSDDITLSGTDEPESDSPAAQMSLF